VDNTDMGTPQDTIRIGTRGSLLALAQANLVAELLRPHIAGRGIELVRITTSGDQLTEKPLAEFGGKGAFVKELENALLAQAVDLAVHSAKDLPVDIAAGLTIATAGPRGAPNDVWIGQHNAKIKDLPPGAIVGTSSLRRQAQLLAIRPDLHTQPLRGNIDTRLRKVKEGLVAGTFLAQAGLQRTKLLQEDAIILPLDEFIPCGGQGTLVVQTRSDDALLNQTIGQINHPPTTAALLFERRVIKTLAGNCLAPIGVCATPREMVNGKEQRGWIARAFVGTPDGQQIARAALLTQEPDEAGLNSLFHLLIDTLNRRGAKEILEKISAT
jgi:hydroxymethylbilane synthase